MKYTNNLICLGFLLLICAGCYCQSGTVALGEDWSFPSGVSVTPASNSGFFSEEASAANNVNTHSFDIAWSQFNPAEGSFVYNNSLMITIDDMTFDTFANQNKTTSNFWMRIWTANFNWAPAYVATKCGVTSIGSDDAGNYLPIWNPCVWGYMKAMYTDLFVTQNMRADSRLKLVYIPGVFDYCEFDFTVIAQAAAANSSFTYSVFNTWFQGAMQDLVDIFGEYSYKLVYTGEDFPFDIPDNWYPDVAYSARDAVAKGMGIRTGITELSNFHLSEIPAYGVTIDSNGYMIMNNSWPLQKNPNRVIGAENECYTTCGYSVSAANLFYAIKMSNLKAIQMGVNWLYVVPTDSYLSTYADHWNWVRMSIGRLPADAIEGWAALRQAQDTFWSDSYNGITLNWANKPIVKNFERFLFQRDFANGQTTKKGSIAYSGILDSDNGAASEGRSTDIVNNQTLIAFLLDDEFMYGSGSVSLKITYLCNLASSFSVLYYTDAGALTSTNLVQVPANGTGNYQTVTFTLSATFQNLFDNSIDFKIANNGTKDVEVLFVRVTKINFTNNPTPSPSSHQGSNSPQDSVSSSNPLYSQIPRLSLILILAVLYLFK